ncbi:MAG: tetratricopeptide repeat protein [Luteibaculaceae bacterium]
MALKQLALILFVLTITYHTGNSQTHQECSEALSAFEQGRYTKSLQLLTESNPKDYACVMLLADTYHKLSKFDEAIKEYNRAEKISKSSYILYLKRGRAYLASNWPEKALTDFKKAERIFDKDEEVHFFLALAYEANNIDNKARKSYEKAVELNPDYALAKFNLSAIYAESKRKDDALKLLESILIEEPEYQQIFDFNLGLLYYDLGEDNAAIVALTRAAEAQGDATHVSLLYRGLSKINIGEYEEGCEDLKRAAESTQEDLTKYYKQNCVGKSGERVKNRIREHQYMSF